MSTGTFANTDLLSLNTPTSTAVVLGEHSGTVLGRTQWYSETRTKQQRRPKRSKLSHGQHGAVPRISRNRTICVAASRELYVRLETLVSSRTLRALSNVRPETCVSSRWF